MKQFNLTMITTFRKPVTVEAETLEEAIEIASNDVDGLNSSTNTLDFDTEVVSAPEETPESQAKKNRFAAMEATATLTSDRIQEKLDAIKSLAPRMKDLGETLVHARNNGISVDKYLCSGGTRLSPLGVKYWYRDGCHRFANPGYHSGIVEDPYFIVGSEGDVFTSTYSSHYKDGVEYPCSTFQVGACRNPSTREEYRLAILRGLTSILESFPRVEREIYNDIDKQIEQKTKEVK